MLAVEDEGAREPLTDAELDDRIRQTEAITSETLATTEKSEKE